MNTVNYMDTYDSFLNCLKRNKKKIDHVIISKNSMWFYTPSGKTVHSYLFNNPKNMIKEIENLKINIIKE